MIDGRDISVVIQGAFHDGVTTLAIDMIGEVLPGAEIIVSTWKGTSVRVHPKVRLVMNDDPGPSVMIFEEEPGSIKLDNCNRQLVSTMGGIEAATRRYVLKLRSDMLLRGCGFIEHYKKSRDLPRTRPYFRQRIVCNSSGTVDPRIGSVAHPGDFFFFGLAEDIRDLYAVPLYVPRQIASEEWADTPVASVWRSLGPAFRGHLCPEMHIWAYHIRKNTGLEVRSIFHHSRELVDATLDSYVDNLIPLDDDQIGLDPLRHRNYGRDNYWRNMDELHFRRLLARRQVGECAPARPELSSFPEQQRISEYKEHVASLHHGPPKMAEDRRRYWTAHLRYKRLKLQYGQPGVARALPLKMLNKRHQHYLKTGPFHVVASSPDEI